jgi:hypothetical protein
MGSNRKIDDFTVVISAKEPTSYFPYVAVYIRFTPRPVDRHLAAQFGRHSCRVVGGNNVGFSESG